MRRLRWLRLPWLSHAAVCAKAASKTAASCKAADAAESPRLKPACRGSERCGSGWRRVLHKRWLLLSCRSPSAAHHLLLSS